MIQTLFPVGPSLEVPALLESMLQPMHAPTLQAGDERMIDFLDGVGQRLRVPALARRYPELGPLGAYLRRGRLCSELARLGTDDRTLRFPKGLVFHIAPGNADTVFVYSWAL
jgi:hypothetical protein